MLHARTDWGSTGVRRLLTPDSATEPTAHHTSTASGDRGAGATPPRNRSNGAGRRRQTRSLLPREQQRRRHTHTHTKLKLDKTKRNTVPLPQPPISSSLLPAGLPRLGRVFGYPLLQLYGPPLPRACRDEGSVPPAPSTTKQSRETNPLPRVGRPSDGVHASTPNNISKTDGMTQPYNDTPTHGTVHLGKTKNKTKQKILPSQQTLTPLNTSWGGGGGAETNQKTTW